MRPSKDSLIPILFLLPLYIFIIAMVFLPIINVIIGSFGVSMFGGSSEVTLEGYNEFLTPGSPYAYSLFFTVYISLIATIISVVVGYLFAAYLTIRRPSIWRRMSTIMVVPLFTPYIVGAFMWWTLLWPRGYLSLLMNGVLTRLGLLHESIPLVNDPYGIGILFGEVWIRFAIALMLLYEPLRLINPELIDAARSLGAGTWTIIRRVFIPMTKYAILATSAIIMLATMAGISIPLILGGSWPQFLNVVIYLDITVRFDYVMAYTSSVFYVITTIVLGYIFFKFTAKKLIIQAR